jgi:cobalt/nickel transport protein
MKAGEPQRTSVALAVLLAGLVGILLMHASAAGPMVGAGERAVAAIRSGHKDYRPWAHPLWTAPEGEAETLLFSLQAGLGGLALGYVWGRMRGSRS